MAIAEDIAKLMELVTNKLQGIKMKLIN